MVNHNECGPVDLGAAQVPAIMSLPASPAIIAEIRRASEEM
jgi:hypothetical protein